MALDYEQSAQLRTNLIFRGRIASAAIKWADSKYGNTALDVTQPQNRRELNYAGEVYRNSDARAAELQPAVVQDPAVQSQPIDAPTGDSTIADASLQGAVEAAIRKVL